MNFDIHHHQDKLSIHNIDNLTVDRFSTEESGKEVFMYRRMKEKRNKYDKDERKQEQCYYSCHYKQEGSHTLTQEDNIEPKNELLNSPTSEKENCQQTNSPLTQAT